MSMARLYLEAVVAIMIMLTLSVTSGFLAAGVTDNRIVILVTLAGVFLATRAIFRCGSACRRPRPANLGQTNTR